MRRLLAITSLTATFVLLAAAAGLGGTAAAPSLTLRRPLPGLERIGQTVTVTGRTTGLPSHTLIELQGLREKPWTVLAHGRTAATRAFTLRWRIGSRTDAGPLQLRVLALRGDKIVARTRTANSAVGPRYIPCAKPVPPAQNIPVGDGWITGGVYIQGGPYPGLDQCEDAAYTVTATGSNGTVAASQAIGPGASYTLVLPAGTYTLRAKPTSTSEGCPGYGQATVQAGRETTADADCDVP